MDNKFEITKEQIIRLHELQGESYSNIRTIDYLEQSFPKAFKPEIEVGKWYYMDSNYNQYLYYITDIKNNQYYAYGFYGLNLRNFTDHTSFIKDSNIYNNLRKATNEEVKDALIAEAKRRYNKGDKFVEPRYNNNHYRFDISFIEYNSYDDSLCQQKSGNGTIYHQGKWAEIIEDEPELNINEWYKSVRTGALVYITGTKLYDNAYPCYGFDSKDRWFEEKPHVWFDTIKEWEIASKEDIEETLIKEAKYRYNVGDTINYIRPEYGPDKLNGFTLKFSKKKNGLYATECPKSDYLFLDGRWAKVIKQSKRKMTVADICNELGEEIEIIK